MTKQQLSAIYICYLIPYITGNAFLPFLPLYTAEMGASSGFTGYYLAIAFASIAFGSMTAGWLSTRLKNHKRFIMADGIIGGVMTALMGFAPNLMILTLITIIGWIVAGNLTAMVLILTGMGSTNETRGRTFGFISTAPALGAIIGGMVAGPMIEQFDYQGLFLAMGMVSGIGFIASFFLEDQPSTEEKQKTDDLKAPLNKTFWLIFIGSILVYTASFGATMIRPFLMIDLNFSPTAIGSVIAVGGAVNLPLPFIIGGLSDRIGRKWLFLTTYLLTTVGLLILMFSTLLWHFYLARVLITMTGTGFALGTAILVDNISPDQRDTALSWFATSIWIGGIAGYLLTGFSIETIGLVNSLIPAIAFAGLATSLTLAVTNKRKEIPVMA